MNYKIIEVIYEKQDIIKYLKKHKYKYEEFGLTYFIVYLKHSNSVAVIHRRIKCFGNDTLKKVFERLEQQGKLYFETKQDTKINIKNIKDENEETIQK